MLKKLKKRLGKIGAAAASSVVVRKRGTLREDYEHTMAAISFAEAGAHNEAFQALECIAEPRKIVVVTTKETFAPELVDYAVPLAQRLGHEIVALSICPPPAAGKGDAETAAKRYQVRTAQAAAHFREEALRHHIAFEHILRAGAVPQVLEHLPSEIRRIDLIITGPDLSSEENLVDAGLPIFRVVPCS